MKLEVVVIPVSDVDREVLLCQARFATPDEVSWVLTVYTMGSLVGVVASASLIKTLSIGRYMVVSALVFAATALACTTGPELGVMIGLRTIQGFAAGGFGPAAFFATFVVAGPEVPRLPFVVTVQRFRMDKSMKLVALQLAGRGAMPIGSLGQPVRPEGEQAR